MRALRFGSYSMAATLAGTPSLFRRKSITRYWRLWPPPRWREVLRPCALRPPELGLGETSERSGRSRVISEKSETVWNRRPGLVGLRERSGMGEVFLCSALEEVDLVAGLDRHDGPLGVGPVADGVGTAVPGRLALAVEGVDVDHADAERLLDGGADLDLVGVRVDHEHVDVLVHQGVGLLRD